MISSASAERAIQVQPSEDKSNANNANAELRALTGIRGIAAFGVVFFHFFDAWVVLIPALGLLAPLCRVGYLGVDLFFILSGFILCYVHPVSQAPFSLKDYGRFMWLRFARIWPNHFATLGSLILLVIASHVLHVTLTGNYEWKGLPFQLTMTHKWPYLPGGAWNHPSWSISAEWFAYLAIFPLCVAMLKREWRVQTCVLTGFMCLAAWMLIASNTISSKGWFPLIGVSLEFFAGSLFFRVYSSGCNFTKMAQTYATAACTLVVAVVYTNCFGAGASMITLLFPVIIVGLTMEKSLIAKLLASPAATWLGRISYAIYMSHGIAQKMLKILLPFERYALQPLTVRILVLLANFALVMLLAIALYYLVEVPARNYLRKHPPRLGPLFGKGAASN